jgi:hypothetical protein
MLSHVRRKTSGRMAALSGAVLKGSQDMIFQALDTLIVSRA